MRCKMVICRKSSNLPLLINNLGISFSKFEEQEEKLEIGYPSHICGRQNKMSLRFLMFQFVD